MEQINIAEILKDAPKGTKFFSSMLGDCYFEEYQERESTYPIRVRFTNHHKETDYRSLSIYGRAVEVDSAECVIFPSKDNRDWSTFKAPWKHKHFKPFERIIIAKCDGRARVYSADFYSHYSPEGFHATVSGLYIKDEYIFPYSGNEDKLGKAVE